MSTQKLTTHSPRKNKVVLNGGKTYTQPDMTLTMSQLLERNLAGMPINQLEPVFYGNENMEMINWEKMTPQEKLTFSRKYKKDATDQLDLLNKKQQEEIQAQRDSEERARLEHLANLERENAELKAKK